MTGPEIAIAVFWFFSIVGVYVYTEETAWKRGFKAGVDTTILFKDITVDPSIEEKGEQIH